MIRRIIAGLLTTLLLITLPSVQAQQPKKVPRIGYHRRSTQLLSPLVSRQFGWLCASVAT
jgi:hypothetical protein